LQDSAAVKVSCSTIATFCWQLTACGVIGHAKQASRLLFYAQDDKLRLAECLFLATYGTIHSLVVNLLVGLTQKIENSAVKPFSVLLRS
jgi:hypothetical protein